jgi:serine/threonine protein kinase/Tol biopolymer transport system component
VIDRDDWARLDELLDAALQLPEAERGRFLDESCGDDREKRARLAELLRLSEDGDEQMQPGGGLRGDVWEEIVEEMETESLGVLGPDARLGRFVIRALIGTGGMGSVYRALDPSLGREVAIKAVARSFRDDAASLRRFEREARLLATLNHPNVAAIYGFELIDGAPYLVLELVEGETLGERLERGPLPIGEALAVAVQIADALQEAHRKGIVHRDLKPANVKLAESGRVKVLDFGIAKPFAGPADEGAAGSGPLDPDPTTTPGTLLGTAPYMSPEQVRGLPVDPRSDLWTFGCVLYEMLTGARAFPGHSAPDVVAAVLRDDVDWDALPPGTPQGARRLLRRCLRKDPRDRLQDAGDARLELTEAAMEEPVEPKTRPRRVRPSLFALAGIAGAALLVGAGYLAWLGRPSREPLRPVRLSLELPKGLSLANDYAAPFALSPDGARLALLAKDAKDDGPLRIYERALDGLDVHPVAGTDGAWLPVFSPDGRSIAFFADRKLKRVALGGGTAETLAEIGGNPRGASWGDDGSIVVSPSQTSGLVRVDAQGGPPRPLTQLDEAAGEVSHRWPQVLPGGRAVLFTVAFEDGSYDEARLEAVSLATGERRRLVDPGAHGRYVPSGHLVFVRGGRLLAVPFDLERLATRPGSPEVVGEGVRYDPQNGGTHVAVSATGTLVYSPGPLTSAEHALTWVDPAGRLTRVSDTARDFREPSLSPDGRRVAVVIGKAAESDLWILDLTSGTLSQVTFGLSPRSPTWTPDGKGVTVGARAEGGWKLLTIPLRDPGKPVTLLESTNRVYPSGWSPDGRLLVYQERRPGTGWDLFAADVGPSSTVVGTRPLAVTPFHEERATLSPDGRFVAYESDELDGIFEIYVRALAEGGAKVRASTTGARWPRFGGAGALYYWYSFKGGLQRIDYHAAGDRFVVDGVGPVWPEPSAGGTGAASRVLVTTGYGGYDVDRANRRFLMLERSAASLQPALGAPVVVLNWAEGLRSRDRP